MAHVLLLAVISPCSQVVTIFKKTYKRNTKFIHGSAVVNCRHSRTKLQIAGYDNVGRSISLDAGQNYRTAVMMIASRRGKLIYNVGLV